MNTTELREIVLQTAAEKHTREMTAVHRFLGEFVCRFAGRSCGGEGKGQENA